MKQKILQNVNSPADLKNIDTADLELLASELRLFLLETVSQTGGHLGSNLGVVELTIALHKVFNTPIDKIVWDIGHQSYIHKMLTGRKDSMMTIRKKNGISGFCRIDESEYDVFGAGHSSTSISAAMGIAKARDLKGEDFNVVAIIGDSSMTSGMAYEAMNNASSLDSKMIVILNDNDMSISPAVGALRNCLAGMFSSSKYISFRDKIKNKLKSLPRFFSLAKSLEMGFRTFASGGNIFESLGFYYIGVIDGNNLSELIDVLVEIRDLEINKPILLHIKTKKGCGYDHAEMAPDKLHGVGTFDLSTGISTAKKSPIFTDIFANKIIQLGAIDDKILAITAGMPCSTGLKKFGEKFPTRLFDVAIAEQHAVTFAAGLAVSGFKPFVAIYSTFLQRCYDQIIHDVCIQNLPVRFIIDRSGFVGQDGETHCGAFDIAMLICIPNTVLMASSSANELELMMDFASDYDKAPTFIRIPKKDASPDIFRAEKVEIGRARLIKEGGSKFAIFSYGDLLSNAIEACEEIKKQYSIDIDIYDMRFAKPIDEDLLRSKIASDVIFTIENGSNGGFGSCVAKFYEDLGFNGKIVQICMQDIFVKHATINEQMIESNLDKNGIFRKIKSNLNIKDV